MRHLHIFLSSPGDVSRERQLAREVMDRLESERIYKDKLKLEVVAWDKPGAGAAMPAQYEPQEAIERGMKKPSDCDIVIVLFWARMGTLLSDKYRKPDGSRYRSGTEYEFLDALNAAKEKGKPDVLGYRRTGAPDINLADPKRKEKEAQWDLVEEFFAEFKNPDGSFQRFFKEYDTPSDFKDLLDQDLRDLIPGYLEPQEPETAPPAAAPQPAIWTQSPYPGLRAFVPAEAPIFYGRSRETDDLVSRLEDSEHRFIAVVGASGSGKSSLVAAGLLPALEKNAIPGSQDWAVVRFTPGEVGDNPFMAFAAKLSPMLEKHGEKPREIAAALQRDTGALARWVRRALEGKPAWAKLLLFIDQFEELFTLVDSQYQNDCIDLLARAAQQHRLRTVVTMRADFYHRCVEREPLAALLRTGSYPLAAPGVGALHEMITRPAEQAGLRFEEGLPERILNDTGSEPGALALMAFALAELYAAKTADGQLTHTAYASFGDVPGAIGKRADDTFGALKPGVQATLGDVFRELVEVDERGVATRRRALPSQVNASTEAETLVTALTDARLLVTSRGENNESTVEVAHEALFRSWPRLAEWIQATADDLRLRRQITQLAAYWQEHGCDGRYRWPDDRVVEAVEMVHHLGLQPKDFSAEERTFLGPLNRERMLADLDDTATPHEQRAIIGVRLSLLGDPRPGVGLREDGLPDIVWCEVPGGEITLEENAGTFTVEPFYIAKYPVTYVQYRTFLEASNGYYNPDWWKGLLVQGDKPGKQFNRRDNHPAENLAWLEAVAFCRWLSQKLGYDIRLPTEWEWQQAATGGNPANEYPWGPEWDGSRANTYESELSRSTAVGMYPQGASPVGALDMAGNVWELCLNEYDNPRKTNLAGDARRVVRGGSWNYFQGRARAAYRGFSYPGGRNGDQGFRVVCSSPIF